MSTTTNLAITLIDTNQSQKEVTANAAVQALEDAITEALTVDVDDGENVLSLAEVRENQMIVLSAGSPGLTGPITVEVPAVKRLLLIRNTSGETATITCADAASGALEGEVLDGDTELLYCDGTEVVQITSGGVHVQSFVDLDDVPAAYTGAGGQAVQVNSAEDGLEFVAPPYDVGVFFPGKPTATQIVMRWVAPRAIDFPDELSGSRGAARVAATGSTAFDVQQNGSSVGTITFAGAATTATFTTSGGALALAAGDVLAIIAPGTPDATLEDISVTFAGSR
jgi:hypothetical protein